MMYLLPIDVITITCWYCYGHTNNQDQGQKSPLRIPYKGQGKLNFNSLNYKLMNIEANKVTQGIQAHTAVNFQKTII